MELFHRRGLTTDKNFNQKIFFYSSTIRQLLDVPLPCIRLSMACSFDENSVVNSCILNALKSRHHFNM